MLEFDAFILFIQKAQLFILQKLMKSIIANCWFTYPATIMQCVGSLYWPSEEQHRLLHNFLDSLRKLQSSANRATGEPQQLAYIMGFILMLAVFGSGCCSADMTVTKSNNYFRHELLAELLVIEMADVFCFNFQKPLVHLCICVFHINPQQNTSQVSLVIQSSQV